MAEVQSNDGSREHSTFASVGEYICTLAIFFGYYIVGDSIHSETCTYMYIKQISALKAKVFTDFSLYFSAFFEKLGLIWCWIIFVDSSGILSHLGAIDRTLLPVDDALTNARRDLLERTVSASSSLYSACSVVSLTRLNHIISRPERDDLNRLMKDQVFVDYFNVFLNLPVSISSCCWPDPVVLRGTSISSNDCLCLA